MVSNIRRWWNDPNCWYHSQVWASRPELVTLLVLCKPSLSSQTASSPFLQGTNVLRFQKGQLHACQGWIWICEMSMQLTCMCKKTGENSTPPLEFRQGFPISWLKLAPLTLFASQTKWCWLRIFDPRASIVSMDCVSMSWQQKIRSWWWTPSCSERHPSANLAPFEGSRQVDFGSLEMFASEGTVIYWSILRSHDWKSKTFFFTLFYRFNQNWW